MEKTKKLRSGLYKQYSHPPLQNLSLKLLVLNTLITIKVFNFFGYQRAFSLTKINDLYNYCFLGQSILAQINGPYRYR